jgi:transposase
MGRPKLSEQIRAEIENHYRDGYSATWANERLDVTASTCLTYFSQFERDDVPRRERMCKPHPRPGPHSHTPAPYTGPAWIG